MAVLQLSTGAVLNANINPATARQIVRDADAAVITPGVTGYDVVRSLTSVTDLELTSATSLAPAVFGVDDIYLTPMQYPEPPAGV